MNTTIPPQTIINTTMPTTTDNMVKIEKIPTSILSILLADEKISGEVITNSPLINQKSNKSELAKPDLSKSQENMLTIKTITGEIDIKTKLLIPIGRNVILSMPAQNNIAQQKPPYSLNIQMTNNGSTAIEKTNILHPNSPQINKQTNDGIRPIITKNINDGMKFTAIIKSNFIKQPNNNQISKPEITLPSTETAKSPNIAISMEKTGQLARVNPIVLSNNDKATNIKTAITNTQEIIPKKTAIKTTNIITATTNPTANIISKISTTQNKTTNTTVISDRIATDIKQTTPSTATASKSTSSTATTATTATATTATASTASTATASTTETDNIKLPNGWSVDLKIIAIQKQGEPDLPKISASQKNIFIGKIVNSSIDNIEIKTDSATFSIAMKNPPPVGSVVLLSIENAAKPPLIISKPLINDEMTQKWDGLRDALTLLGVGDIVAAKNIMQSIPQTGIKISSSLLFFINAIRGDNINSLLGQSNLQSLGRISKINLNKLTRDFQMTKGRATDSAGSEWRSYNIPILNDNAINNLQLFIKKYEDEVNDDDEKEKNDDSNKKNSKRFIIEVNLTKLGPLQLDGMANNKNIELMIRSHKSLDSNMRDEIKQLFIKVIEPLGLTGSVGFHISKKFDVKEINQKQQNKRGISV